MNERTHRRGKGVAEKKMRTQGRRDNPHCFMGIDEGGGKQKRKRSDWWLRMLCMGGGAEGEAQRQDSAQEILKTAQ